MPAAKKGGGGKTGHGHGVEPPTRFRGELFPVAQGIGDVLARGLFHRPAKDAESLAKGGVYGDGLGWILLEFGVGEAVRAQAAVGLFPKRWGKRQPA
jgi:hypothetical protein